MNITFRQLRLFLALAETGSVSAAAKVMHVTQPTASMQLREVTQAVGQRVSHVDGIRHMAARGDREAVLVGMAAQDQARDRGPAAGTRPRLP